MNWFVIHHFAFIIHHLSQHAVQGSNLPFPALETSAPPLEQTARLKNDQCGMMIDE